MDDSAPTSPDAKRVPFLALFVATGFYSGYSPWASGTVGSLVGAIIFLLPGVSNPMVLLPLILFGFVFGARSSALVAEKYGNALTRSAQIAKETFQGNHPVSPDPSIVVIDEIIGMLVSLAFLDTSFLTLSIAFAFFRIFDILKPVPINRLERISNGWGIMLDDVAAGIYANIATRATLFAIGFNHLSRPT